MTREKEIRQAAKDCTGVEKTNMFSGKVELVRNTYEVGAEWADSHPQSPWHSVADGDFPKTRNDTRYLLDGVTCKNAYIVTDGKEWWVDYYVPMDNSWASQSTPTHWMEIPQLPKESEVNDE